MNIDLQAREIQPLRKRLEALHSPEDAAQGLKGVRPVHRSRRDHRRERREDSRVVQADCQEGRERVQERPGNLEAVHEIGRASCRERVSSPV